MKRVFTILLGALLLSCDNGDIVELETYSDRKKSIKYTEKF